MVYGTDLFPWPASGRKPGAGPVFRVGAREQLRPPKEVQDYLTRAGGLNRFGKPNLILRWGWEPTNFVWSVRARNYERRPRYTKRDRWYVEQWFAPENYGTPRTWRYFFTENIYGREVDTLGPFPTFGEYEQLLMLQTPHLEECPRKREQECLCGGGRYQAPTVALMEALVSRLHRMRDVSKWDRKYRHSDELAKEERDFDNYAEDMIRDSQPVFELSPTVFLGHKNVLPERWRVKGVVS